MIETVMFIALGFVTACLLALALAPALWRRAVRLTRHEIEATMPISVSDIQADKDILRAEYAVELRRLELALDQASQRAARHLMERNRHMVEMGKLESEIASLKDAVAERTKAGSVMEQTVRKRLPELEQDLKEAHTVIAVREQELAERARAFENQTESLELAQAMIHRQEEEIDKLRASLEAGGSAILSRWGKSAETDEAAVELARKNGELQAELSRLREKISMMEDVDEADATELREELHRLANLMVGGARPTSGKSAPEEPKATAAKDAGKKTDGDSGSSRDTSKDEDAPANEKAAKGKRKSLIDRLSGLKGKRVKEPA